MAEILRMPNVLAGATEATIAGWVVDEGSVITPGMIIAEIETEKAVVELPAERDGVLGVFLADAGETVLVGAPIAVVLDFADETVDLDALAGKAATPTTAGNAADAHIEPVRVGDDDGYSAQRPTDILEPVTPSSETANEVPPPEGAMAPSSPAPARHKGRMFVSPLVRRLARERGFNLEDLSGSGPGGRIVRRDAEAHDARAHANSPTPTAAPAKAKPATVGPAEGTTTPHSAMRRAIARRLTESKTTIPHFYLRAACRVDRLLDLRREINETTPGKISVNDLVVKAVAAAYRAVPEANVVWTDDALVRFDKVDVAIAISTPRGLVTPVVRDVGSSSISQLSVTIAELAGRAREGRLRQQELEGGTFAVSNLGMYDIEEFAAIINPPHSGILAVGAARQQAIVDNGSLAVGTIMQVVLSADHRALDGALAARWLGAFVTAVEHPLTLLV
jgi:pyruvate dehydrogenase E2 component (dihydrolipoamide acetyltransferase)